MALVLEWFNPMQGDTGIFDDLQVRVRGLDQLKLNDKSLGLPPDDVSRSLYAMGNAWHERCWAGSQGFRGFLAYKRVPARPPIPADVGVTLDNQYPFISVPVTVDTNRGTMKFTGGTIHIDIYSRSDINAQAASSEPYKTQTITVNLPNGEFPIPNLVRW
jgi:hypothetical protein